jgi:hypothetical protein
MNTDAQHAMNSMERGRGKDPNLIYKQRCDDQSSTRQMKRRSCLVGYCYARTRAQAQNRVVRNR